MAQWFIVRDGNETGPFTSQQLKDAAKAGDLKQSDQVRRDDMEAAVPVGKIKGLLQQSNKQAVPEPADIPPLPDAGVVSKPKSRKLLIGCGTLFLFVGGCFCMVAYSVGHTAKLKEALAKGDELWKAGQKAEAVDKYQPLLSTHESQFQARLPTVYGRIIEFHFEQGHEEEAQKLLQKAVERDLEPYLTAPVAVNALAATKRDHKERLRKEKLADGTPQEQLAAAHGDDLIEAESLYRQFHSNQVAADEKFTDKIVMVEGEVVKVDSDWTGTWINLAHRSGSIGILCKLSRSGSRSEDLKKIESGSWVKVRGNCDGRGLGGTLVISDCDFILVNP